MLALMTGTFGALGFSAAGPAAAQPDPTSEPAPTARAAWAPAIAPPSSVPRATSRQRARVRITVMAHSSLGKVFCAMWRGPKGYPTKRKKAAHDGVDRKLRAQRAVIAIDDVEPGEYAVACFHDENANNDLDTNFLGIPVEGTGASNDARGFMGPPDYDDARFIVEPHQTKQVIVPMHYIFG